MKRVQITQLGTPDLLRTLSPQMFRRAKEHRRNLSGWLELVSTTDDADRKSGLDAFERLIREAGVITRSLPDHGIYADTFGEFMDAPNGRVLFTEWAWRQYRRSQQSVQQRALSSLDFAVGTAMRPYTDDTTIIMDDLRPAIPVAEVLSRSEGIEGNSFRGLYLTEPTAAQKRFVRVGELAEIPKVTITVGQHTIDMFKYGRGLELSYEVMRRESLDRLRTMIQLVAVQNEIDKLATIIDVLVNGDGNANTAATSYNLTTLDPAAVAGTLSLKGWIAFQEQWENPYMMSHALQQRAVNTQIKLLNVGSANLPLAMLPVGVLGNVTDINRRTADNVRIGATADAPTLKIVGFDRRFAIERLFEIGSETEETERYASRQSEALYLTEVEGYRVLNRNAAKILDVAA